MTPEKVLEVIERYRRLFREGGLHKRSHSHAVTPDSPIHAIEHCFAMLDTLEELVREGRTEKAFRWLGFIQGVLWANKIYPLDELKNHNRPDNDTSPPG